MDQLSDEYLVFRSCISHIQIVDINSNFSKILWTKHNEIWSIPPVFQHERQLKLVFKNHAQAILISAVEPKPTKIFSFTFFFFIIIFPFFAQLSPDKKQFSLRKTEEKEKLT